MDNVGSTLLVVMQLVNRVAAEQYYVYDGNMTWTDASAVCQLAKPNISFTKNGEFLEMNTNTFRGETWVGYTPYVGSLYFHGCYRKESLVPQAVRFYSTRRNVYVCCFACGTPYFAIGEDNTCLCLENRTTDFGVVCRRRCNNITCESSTFYTLALFSKPITDGAWSKLREYGYVNSSLILQYNNGTSFFNALCKEEQRTGLGVHDVPTTLSANVTTPKTNADITGLYVGVGFGIVLFVVLVVLIVVLRRQIYRLITKKPKEQKSELKTGTYGRCIDSPTNGTSTGSSSIPSDTPGQTNYFMLEPASTVFKKQLNQTSVNDDDENSYDVCTQNRSKYIPYPSNRIADDIPSKQHVYENSNFNRGHGTDPIRNKVDLYNSKVGEENTYDVHECGQGFQKITNQPDNIYNNTYTGLLEESIYNNTGYNNTQEATYGNIQGLELHDVTDTDGEGTYNHIS